MEFPDTIEGFGYKFNEDGQLRHIEMEKPFEFEAKKDNHSYNQARYEALGELITPYVNGLLEERCGLKRYPCPKDVSENEGSSFIFCSDGFFDAEKILVLIHGSGVVRAGQWARRLIINDSLDSGTQIPFIERAKKEGFGVVVLNTNNNMVSFNNEIKVVRGSESAVAHGKYVWENYIKDSSAKMIAIVAHSYGGVVLTSLYDLFKKDFQERVFAVALTDSVHYICSDVEDVSKIARNWVSSSLPLDESVTRNFKDIPCVSAGCVQHELTSWSSFESIFKFFHEKLTASQESLKIDGTPHSKNLRT